ncbi:hypothetical protein KKA13_04755, partial [Patescibacteria group bacterium]|nr:hypothetical protein [Patescibacteria group bacterium]
NIIINIKMKHIYNKFTSWDLKKRFVYAEVPPIDVAKITESVPKQGLTEKFLEPLKRSLGPEKLSALRKKIAEKGARAVDGALGRLPKGSTESAAKKAAEEAFNTVARAEARAATKAAEELAKTAAEKIATEAAARAAARKAAAKAVAKESGKMAGKGTIKAAKQVSKEQIAKKIAAASGENVAARTLARESGKAVGKKVVEEGALEAAEQAAGRAAAKKATAEITKRSAGQFARSVVQKGEQVVAEQVVKQGGKMVLRNAPAMAAEEAAALAAGTETAAAAAGITAGAVAAFLAPLVAGIALEVAADQGYELYKDVSRTGWEGKGAVRERLARDQKTPWKVENIDSTDKRQGDLPYSVEQKNGDWCRGAALLGRNTASELMVEAHDYGDGTVAREISSAKIHQMIDYANEVKTRIHDLSIKPEITVGSPVYLEAEASYTALDAAIKAANAALGKHGLGEFTNENMPEYKEAEKAREAAQFKNDVVDLDNNVKTLRKIVGEMKGGDEKLATAIVANLDTASTQLKAAENKDQLKPVADSIKAQQKEVDKLILSQKEALIKKEEAARFIRAFVRSKVSPEQLKNKEFVEQVMAVCLAQMTPNKKGAVAPEDFLKQLNAVFPEASINPDSYALKNDGYFNESPVGEGKIDGLEGFLWHNASRAYVLGLVAKCKNHPAGFGGSTEAYIGELKKFLHNEQWQKEADMKYKEEGEQSFYAFVTSSLPTPEKYFGYDKEEEAEKAKAKAEAKKKRAASGGYRPRVAPITPTPEPAPTPETPVPSGETPAPAVAPIAVDKDKGEKEAPVTVSTDLKKVLKEGVKAARNVDTAKPPSADDVRAAIQDRLSKERREEEDYGKAIKAVPEVETKYKLSGYEITLNKNDQGVVDVWVRKENKTYTPQHVAKPKAEPGSAESSNRST